MCKRRATPHSPIPPHPGQPPSPHRLLPAASAFTPNHSAGLSPAPPPCAPTTLSNTAASCSKAGKYRQRAWGPAAGAAGAPRGPPLPGLPAPSLPPAPLSPHEQRSLGLALHLGAAVPRPPSLEVVPCGASHRCGFPLRPDGVRCLTGTMCLGVVRSRHVPQKGREGGRGGERLEGRERWGGAAKLFFF